MEYVNFKDEKIPLGKRKVAYIKWLLKKGYSMYESKVRANKKFGFAKKAGVLLLWHDPDNVSSKSYFQHRDYWTGIDKRKYEEHKVVETNFMSEERINEIVETYEALGWDIYEKNPIA